MVELEQMREMHLLQDRIELLGSVPPGQVGNVSAHPRPRGAVLADHNFRS